VASLALAALLVGQYPVTPREILRLAGEILGVRAADGTAAAAATVILSIRLPRVLAALLVGAALAAAGTAYQGIFRNPLVSPDILGVSAGASLGAVLGIFLSLPVLGIQLLAFSTGLGTVALVWAVAASVRGHEPVIVLVLAGVVIGALAGALVSLLKVLADPYDQLPAITFWLLGSLAHVTTGDVLATIPLVLLGLLPLHLLRWRLNLLTLGDEEAAALGADVRRLRALAIAGATLTTAAVVAISGTIGWIGLVVPHLCRLLVGPDLLRLLPCATLAGAGFLLLVDTLARSAASTEIPLGILTSLLGAPFFLWLLARGRQGWT
jgi:iron complex transport system permease protein